jgi:hypothetical protein
MLSTRWFQILVSVVHCIEIATQPLVMRLQGTTYAVYRSALMPLLFAIGVHDEGSKL